MKKKSTIFIALFSLLCIAAFSQHHASFNSPYRLPAKEKAAKKIKTKVSYYDKAVDVMAVAGNGYVAGTTHNVYFTFTISNTDQEYVDSLSLTFPSGMTLNSVSNNVSFGPAAGAGVEEEMYNGIDGQTVTWGDNDNDNGGITSQGTIYTFSANLTFDAGLTGDQIISGFASGDQFAQFSADQEFEITLSEIENEARVQIIHNSADAASQTIDVRIDGDLADTSLDNLSFRNATPFITVPAITDLEVTVNPESSLDDSNALYTQTFNLDPGISYVIVANGIISASGYNPPTPFSLDVFAPALEEVGDVENTAMLLHHGATDVPAVNIYVANNGQQLVDGIVYSEFDGYFTVNTADYVLHVTLADGTTNVGNYSAPLEALSLGGSSLAILASGFLNPIVNSDGPSFGLWAALAQGGALIELTAVIVENDFPCNAIPLENGIVETVESIAATTDEGEPVPEDGACDGILVWCDGPNEDNPDFDGLARITNTVWFSFVAPASGGVEVSTCNAETDFDTQLALYSAEDCSDYSTYTLVASNDDYAGDAPCASSNMFASRLMSCGLIGGETYYVQIDGWQGAVGQVGITYTELESTACTARLQIVHNSPDAAAEFVDVRVNGNILAGDHDNLEFRHATATIDAPAATPLSITLNDAESVDDTNPYVLVDDVVLEPGQSYQIIAQGLVSESGYNPSAAERPLELSIVQGFEEVNISPNNTLVSISHGATDLPNISVFNQFGSLGTIIGNLAYSNLFGYENIPAENIIIGVSDASQNEIIGSFFAPIADLNLGGSAITIFASGFGDPSQNSDGPAFGLWASVPDGGMLIPFGNVTSVKDIESLNSLSIYPNPVSENLTIDFDLLNSEKVSIDFFNVLGQSVKAVSLGKRSTGFNREQVFTGDLPAGFYLVNLGIGDRSVATKIQVIR